MTEHSKGQNYIRGEIVFTIYENSTDHFTIAKIKIHDTNEDYNEKDIVGKGHFINLQQGVVYEFYGQLISHPKFGLQYDIHAYQTFVPETEEAVITYLSSDLFPGVGKKSAEKIVHTLGEQAIPKIIENPQVLDQVSGLRNKTKQALIEALQENQGFELVAVHLTKYSISLKMAQTLYRLYRGQTLDILKQNPYQFVFEVEGFSFIMADKIAMLNNVSKEDENRIQASCYHALQMSTLEGHVYLPLDECVDAMRDILVTNAVHNDRMREQIEHLAGMKRVILREGQVYLPSLYYAEDQFSSHIKRMMEETIDLEITDAELMKIIGAIEEEEVLSYGTDQFTAISQAIRSKIMILTGGPGTGKTTVIKGIIKTYAKLYDLSIHRHDYEKKSDYPFILTAPTGRAAKRMQESTGLKAMTIHRLLGWDGHISFEKNEHEQLEGKFLVIDEFSMVDTWLANHLFKAIPDDMQVLIVGDEDQLPSVGPGQVLADLLSSDVIPIVQLNEVYRQKEGSKIIHLAHEIKNDRLVVSDIERDKDFSFIPCQSHQVIDVVTTIFERVVKKGLPIQDIQVLAPMYKTGAGIHNINKHVQELINPKASGKRERFINEATYRVGDRVLQLVNQPEDGVYNGDIGEIIHILSAKETEAEEEQIVIQFDEKEVTYNRSSYLNFMHAYCISIHKSQGSEFPIVVLPVVSQYRRMLRKNLLYTAITRSKQSLIICGEMDAFMKGIETLDTNKRYTTLKRQLELKMDKSLQQKLDTEEDKNAEDPDELSPYDFL